MHMRYSTTATQGEACIRGNPTYEGSLHRGKPTKSTRGKPTLQYNSLRCITLNPKPTLITLNPKPTETTICKRTT